MRHDTLLVLSVHCKMLGNGSIFSKHLSTVFRSFAQVAARLLHMEHARQDSNLRPSVSLANLNPFTLVCGNHQELPSNGIFLVSHEGEPS
jgi:hypothetical protein